MSNTPARPCTTTALLWQNSLSWISTPSATCLSTGARLPCQRPPTTIRATRRCRSVCLAARQLITVTPFDAAPAEDPQRNGCSDDAELIALGLEKHNVVQTMVDLVPGMNGGTWRDQFSHLRLDSAGPLASVHPSTARHLQV